LLRQLWASLETGGVLFLHATPNRWYPLEQHTTRLWGLNYLPDPVAFRAAHRFSRQFGRSGSWEELLRRGIRGATRGEITRILEEGTVLRPSRLGCRDDVDIWYAESMTRNPRRFKVWMRAAFKFYGRITGWSPTPGVTIALMKS
jgi:hypothetical protein